MHPVAREALKSNGKTALLFGVAVLTIEFLMFGIQNDFPDFFTLAFIPLHFVFLPLASAGVMALMLKKYRGIKPLSHLLISMSPIAIPLFFIYIAVTGEPAYLRFFISE